MTWLKLLWSIAKKVPVIATHFPGPLALVVIVAMAAAATASSCVTSRLNAGALAEARLETAQCRADHAESVAASATKQVEIVTGAKDEILANQKLNNEIYLAQARALSDVAGDKAALGRVNRSIEELHHDAAFDCRRLPLSPTYLRGVSFPAEEVRPAAARP